jgi:hypothetical protein
MNKNDSTLEVFEVFLTKHGIESTPQGIKTAEHANQIVVAMTKHMFKAQSYKIQEIALGESGGKCDLYTKPMSDEGLAPHYMQKTIDSLFSAF